MSESWPHIENEAHLLIKDKPDIDGLLVGGASLKADSLLQTMQITQNLQNMQNMQNLV